MVRRVTVLTVGVAVVVGMLGCGSASSKPIECVSSEVCNFDPPGQCIADEAGKRWCAYPSADCPSGWEWSQFAELANECVAEGLAPAADAGVPDAPTADAAAADAATDAAEDAGPSECPYDPATTAGAANGCSQLDSPGGEGCHICVLSFTDGHEEAHSGDCCEFQKCLDTFGPWPWGPCE